MFPGNLLTAENQKVEQCKKRIGREEDRTMYILALCKNINRIKIVDN